MWKPEKKHPKIFLVKTSTKKWLKNKNIHVYYGLLEKGTLHENATHFFDTKKNFSKIFQKFFNFFKNWKKFFQKIIFLNYHKNMDKIFKKMKSKFQKISFWKTQIKTGFRDAFLRQRRKKGRGAKIKLLWDSYLFRGKFLKFKK